MDQRVQAVVSFIKDDLHRIPSLNALAALVNLSPSHLRLLFKAETGMTPAQYLKAMRMQRAADLLATTYLSVKEIMGRVGLKNKSHFTYDFKKAYGLTPAQYRVRSLANDSEHIINLDNK